MGKTCSDSSSTEIKMLRSQGRHTEKVRTNLSDLGKAKDNPGTGSLKSRTEDKMGTDQDEVAHRVG